MLSVVIGILLAVILLVLLRRRGPAAGEAAIKPTPMRWGVFACGLLALLTLAAAWAWPRVPAETVAARPFGLSVVFTVATVILGGVSLARRDRGWPTWAGLIAGLIPAVFWLIFAAGYIFGGG
jgi:peptidoglycan/LPS O-acetylase OafA/YrhL